MTDNNEWELGSGLALDGAKVEVTGMEFGFNANIPGALCANFTFTNMDDGEDIEQSFSVGKGWDTDRTGQTLVSDNGKPRRINKNTNYGRLITSALELLDDPSVLGGSPKDATIWLHTCWQMGTVPVLTRNPSTGQEKEKDAFVFVEWRGHSVDKGAKTGKASGSKAGTSKGTSSTKATSKKADDSDIPEGVEADLWEQLLELARAADDHDAFLEAALDLDEVDGNKAAQKAVMGTKAGSVWAGR